jgi:3-(3-hydroxy-phenyl)propionate hydroxylase
MRRLALAVDDHRERHLLAHRREDVVATEHEGGGRPESLVAASDTPVVVVGAGAAGLTAALRLASLGVPSTVLDRREATALTSPAVGRPGSSGEVVTPVALEAWSHLDTGIGVRLGAVGVRWDREEILWGRRVLHGAPARCHRRGGEREHLPLALPHHAVRTVLLELADRHELVELRLGTRVLGAVPGRDEVVLLLDRGVLAVPWVLAADGAGSTMRLVLGIPTSSVALGHVVVTLDLHGHDGFVGLDSARRSWFSPPSDRRGHLLVTPQPDRTWRLDWTHPRTIDLTGEERSGRLRKRLDRAVGPDGWAPSTPTIRRVGHHVADSYRQGRVVLVGEAAHQVTWPQGNGLADGVLDAMTAADAVAVALRDPGAGDAAVDRYAVTRRAAALAARPDRLRACRRRVPDTAPGRLVRAAALAAAAWSPTARRFLGEPVGPAEIGRRPPDEESARPTIPSPAGPPDVGQRSWERV